MFLIIGNPATTYTKKGITVKFRITIKFRWGVKKLRKNSFESVYKEWYIFDATELISESLYFSIETLGRGVCRTILKLCYLCTVNFYDIFITFAE